MRKLLALCTLLLTVSCAPRISGVNDENIVNKVEPSFNSILNNVFEVKCMNCHNAFRMKGGINLQDYEAVLDVYPPIVIKHRPSESPLYTSIVSGEMPPAAEGKAVTAYEAKVIAKWIELGAPKELPPPAN